MRWRGPLPAGFILDDFVDGQGEPVDRFVNDHAMSMPTGRLKRVPNKILISGGFEKTGIMLAALIPMPERSDYR